MPAKRLINCDFFLKGAFDDVASVKAKLLYFYLFINADDFGFVGNANKIIKTLEDENTEENGLVTYSFVNAADDLVSKGFLFRFTDRHQNQILLIRHWFIHNKYEPRILKYLSTNYLSLRAQVEVVDGCYEFKEKPLKEKDTNNANNTNNTNENQKDNNEEQDELEKHWEEVLKGLEEIPSKTIEDPFYENFEEQGDLDNGDKNKV